LHDRASLNAHVRTITRALPKLDIAAEIRETPDRQALIVERRERMKKLGVVFRGAPKKMGPVTIATFEDICGNLIQIAQQ
jgi:hypothetical protein